MSEKQTNECPNFGLQPPPNYDRPPPVCPDPCADPSRRDVDLGPGILKDKYGLGAHRQCDPMTTGEILPTKFEEKPDRRVLNKYPKSIRGANEAMLDLFSNVVVIDERGEDHRVPIIWGSQERAVAYAIGENVRPDASLVVDRVRIPLMAINFTDISQNLDRYTYHWSQNFVADRNGRPQTVGSELRPNDTVFGFPRGVPVDIGYQLTVWTYYIEDMIQILEQVLLKFSPLAYIRVHGVQWETIVKLDGMSNLTELEPGQNNRVVKFQFSMTVEHYIAQPVARYKSVLSSRIDFVDAVNEEDITEVLSQVLVES